MREEREREESEKKERKINGCGQARKSKYLHINAGRTCRDCLAVSSSEPIDAQILAQDPTAKKQSNSMEKNHATDF